MLDDLDFDSKSQMSEAFSPSDSCPMSFKLFMVHCYLAKNDRSMLCATLVCIQGMSEQLLVRLTK